MDPAGRVATGIVMLALIPVALELPGSPVACLERDHVHGRRRAPSRTPRSQLMVEESFRIA
jgi:hypothetical protein